jgi:DNA-binding GntR family transcriptional regulator
MNEDNQISEAAGLLRTPLIERNRAYESLLRVLLRGELRNASGQPASRDHPASEEQVIRPLGFNSRMPVRMAIAILVAEGLVRQEPRRGFWPAEVDDRLIPQVGRLRAGVEGMVAATLQRILTTMTPTDAGRDYRAGFDEHCWLNAQSALEEMCGISQRASASEGAAVDRSDEMDFADLDTAFHVSLAAAADYDMATRHIREWRNLMRLYRIQHNVRYTASALRSIIHEHEQLMAAVREPYADAAERARAHVDSAIDRCWPESVVVEEVRVPAVV